MMLRHLIRGGCTPIAAAPDAEIILTGSYDPDVGEFSFADPLFSALNRWPAPPYGLASPTRALASLVWK